jgi:nucleoside-diphosphate-sugar epimerase
MGRSLLHELRLADSTAFPDRVLALGSHARQIDMLDGSHVQVEGWQGDTAAEWQPTIAVHLAYLTADRITESTAEAYRGTNAGLTNRGLDLQALPSLRAFMFASSGAATVAGEDSALGRHPYSAQKAEDEDRYLRAGRAGELPTLAARLWSVSGPYCTRPRTYAFSDMVLSCLRGEPIRVKAKGEVLRRYVDAGEFLAACLALNLGGRSGAIDSAGELVEMRGLAAAIADELGGTMIAAPIDPEVEPDTYMADPSGMADAAAHLGIRFTDLSGQIRRTSHGLRC